MIFPTIIFRWPPKLWNFRGESVSARNIFPWKHQNIIPINSATNSRMLETAGFEEFSASCFRYLDLPKVVGKKNKNILPNARLIVKYHGTINWKITKQTNKRLYHLENRWHKCHVLVYHGPLLFATELGSGDRHLLSLGCTMFIIISPNIPKNGSSQSNHDENSEHCWASSCWWFRNPKANHLGFICNLINNGRCSTTKPQPQLRSPSRLDARIDLPSCQVTQWRKCWPAAVFLLGNSSEIPIWVFPKIVGFPPKSSIKK